MEVLAVDDDEDVSCGVGKVEVLRELALVFDEVDGVLESIGLVAPLVLLSSLLPNVSLVVDGEFCSSAKLSALKSMGWDVVIDSSLLFTDDDGCTLFSVLTLPSSLAEVEETEEELFMVRWVPYRIIFQLIN